jgi:hypothetical protein
MSTEETTADSQFVTHLKNHPRMASALAGMLVLLSQAGNVAAAGGGTIS